MRTAQLKVALRPADREFLAWAAGRLGEPTAAYVSQVLADFVTERLADKEVRFAYKVARVGGADGLADTGEAVMDPAAARALRAALRPGRVPA